MNSIKLNEELAELCGVILGDGHIHTYYNKITITGSLEDIYYYKIKIIPLFEKYFKGKIFLRKGKDKNSYYFWIENKEMLDFFINIGLKRGHKKKASIPKMIKENNKMLISFLRGLFDTDGCLKFSKQSRDYLYYPRIRLCFQYSPLITDLREILNILGFRYSFGKDGRYNTFYFEISGKENLEKWIKLIGMNNPVHKSKYVFWKRFGRYLAKSTLKERLKALNLNIDEIT